MKRNGLGAMLAPAMAAALGLSSLAGCASDGLAGPRATGKLVSDRLFLGRSIPGGGEVSEAAWERFVREIVTPRFPGGMTIWRAQGQWREAAGATIREPVMVIEIIHPDTAESNRSLAVVAQAYKALFAQQDVLRVTNPTEIRSIEAPSG